MSSSPWWRAGGRIGDGMGIERLIIRSMRTRRRRPRTPWRSKRKAGRPKRHSLDNEQVSSSEHEAQTVPDNADEYYFDKDSSDQQKENISFPRSARNKARFLILENV